MICPNLSNPQIRQEFDELKSVLGEDMAYLIWDRNGGYGLDKTRDGKPSKLFNDLLGLTDRKSAIEIKAKTLSKSFKQWFGNSKVVDENGEPLVVYHGSRIAGFNKFKGYFPEDSELHSGYFFSNKEYASSFKSEKGELFPVFLNASKPHYEDFGVEHDRTAKMFSFDEMNFDSVIGDDFGTKHLTYVVKSSNQIKSIFNTGVFNRYSDNIYDNEIINKETNRQQTSINGSMSQEIVSNFENYFPDYSHFNDEQRKVVADLVEQGRIQLSCTI